MKQLTVKLPPQISNFTSHYLPRKSNQQTPSIIQETLHMLGNYFNACVISKQ